MAKDQTSDIVFQADISQFTREISRMKNDMYLITSEFEASSSALDDWSKESEGLEMKLKQLNSTLGKQEAILNANKSKMDEYKATLEKNKQSLAKLKDEYDKVVAAEGDKSKSAKALARQMSQVEVAISKNEKAIRDEQVAYNKQTATVNKTKKEIANYTKELEELGKESKDAKKNTEELGEATNSFGSSMKGIGKGLAAGVAAIGAAAAGAAASFFALAESTREFREDYARLDSAFASSGKSAQSASETYKTLFGVIGESDTAVEAAQQIALLAKNEEQAAKWAELATGVVGKFGDALKSEAFFESANETLKLGEATGTFTQMLEGTGYSVDKFNSGLAKLTTQEEKQAYMLKISNELLGEAGEEYKQHAKDVIEAREAEAELEKAMANLGKVAEPIVTIFKEGFAKVLVEITPLMQRLGNAFELLLSDNKVTGMQRLADIFLELKEKAQEAFLGLLDGATEVIPELLPKIAEFLGQAISQIVEFAPSLLSAGLQLFSSLVEAIPPTINMLLEQLPSILDSVISSLNDMIPMLLDTAIQVFSSLVDAIPSVIEKLVEILPQLLESITGFIQENLPIILESFTTLLMSIVDAIPVVLVSLLEALPTIILTITNFIVENLPFIFEMAVELFLKIVEAIPVLIANLIQTLPTIIKTIFSIIGGAKADLFKLAFSLFLEIVKAIPKMLLSLVTSLGEILTTIEDAFKDAPTMLYEVGKDIVKGLWEGIISMGDWLWKKVTGFFDDIVGWAKKALDENSPSKKFMKMGEFAGEGFGIGFDESMDQVRKTIQNDLDFSDINANLGKVDTNSSINGVSSFGKTVNLNYTVNSPKALSRREIYLQAKKMQTILGGVN